MSENSTSPKVGFISLGCPKALVDSERILTQLRVEGYDVVPSYDDADLVIVNTCGFIDAAKEESLEAISEALNENGKVIVTGCLGARKEEIYSRYPQVLGVTGPHAYEEVMGAVHRHLPAPQQHDPFINLVPPQGIKLTPAHYAYVKISEGCNHRCTFCIIPSMRGNLASREAADILTEAERLVESGVKELLIVSQDTSAYGVDLKYRTSFWSGRPVRSRLPELCDALGSLGVWIRLHYVYPYPHVDGIIPMMAERKILPYLDIPFQHASPRILKLMKRPAATEDTIARINGWRKICPDLCIRSTFIVGFPGETEEEFEQLLDFLQIAQLDRVGCFRYSPVDGAKANDLPDPVAEPVKAERYKRFMKVQQEISASRLRKKVGQTLDILIDEVEDRCAVGRTSADAPEIDGNVFLEATDIRPGDIVSGEVQHSDAHDLWASVATTDRSPAQ
jgi:ribosomal protein S12 methylthiotransferase